MQGTNKQVKHLYVVGAGTGSNVSLATCQDGTFKIKGASGAFTTDIIDPKTVRIKATKAADMTPKKMKKTITINSSYIPKKGDVLIVNLKVPCYGGLSDYETLERQAVYTVTETADESTKSTAYVTIVNALTNLLNANMKTLPEQVVTVTNDNTSAITIVAADPEWKLGVMPLQFATFTLNSENVDSDSVVTTGSTSGLPYVAYDWATFSDAAPVAYSAGNGKLIADLEYFCLGNRGDVYRGISYPNVIYSDYKVDASLTYDVLDISYAFTGDGENSTRTEKNIILVAPKKSSTGSSGTDYQNELSTVLTALNTACGTSASYGNN